MRDLEHSRHDGCADVRSGGRGGRGRVSPWMWTSWCAWTRRADRRSPRHAAEREVLLYILHGVLHCLGHDDHDDEADRADARGRRNWVLRADRRGAVFDVAARRRGGRAGGTRLMDMCSLLLMLFCGAGHAAGRHPRVPGEHHRRIAGDLCRQHGRWADRRQAAIRSLVTDIPWTTAPCGSCATWGWRWRACSWCRRCRRRVGGKDAGPTLVDAAIGVLISAFILWVFAVSVAESIGRHLPERFLYTFGPLARRRTPGAASAGPGGANHRACGCAKRRGRSR